MQPPELDNFPLPLAPIYDGQELAVARCTLCGNTGVRWIRQQIEYAGGRHFDAYVSLIPAECDCEPEYAEGF